MKFESTMLTILLESWPMLIHLNSYSPSSSIPKNHDKIIKVYIIFSLINIFQNQSFSLYRWLIYLESHSENNLINHHCLILWLGRMLWFAHLWATKKLLQKKINSLIRNIIWWQWNKLIYTEVLCHYEVAHNDGLVPGIFYQEPHFQPSPKYFQQWRNIFFMPPFLTV